MQITLNKVPKKCQECDYKEPDVRITIAKFTFHICVDCFDKFKDTVKLFDTKVSLSSSSTSY